MLLVHFNYLWGFGKEPPGSGEAAGASLQQPSLSMGYPIPAWDSQPLAGGQARVTVASPSSPPQLPGMQTQRIPCSRSSCWNPSGLSCLQNHPSLAGDPQFWGKSAQNLAWSAMLFNKSPGQQKTQKSSKTASHPRVFQPSG